MLAYIIRGIILTVFSFQAISEEIPNIFFVDEILNESTEKVDELIIVEGYL